MNSLAPQRFVPHAFVEAKLAIDMRTTMKTALAIEEKYLAVHRSTMLLATLWLRVVSRDRPLGPCRTYCRRTSLRTINMALCTPSVDSHLIPAGASETSYRVTTMMYYGTPYRTLKYGDQCSPVFTLANHWCGQLDAIPHVFSSVSISNVEQARTTEKLVSYSAL